MNRGAGRQMIFVQDTHREIFLELLREIHEMFEVETHAYCLMDNHYHLLLRTPQGNLSRAMRHLNGVYTQRYNRIQKTDGPLYRGRYKAILIDVDAYLLNAVFVKIVDRFYYAISCCLASLFSPGLSGFNITTSGLDQSRVCPLQRSGLSAFACA